MQFCMSMAGSRMSRLAIASCLSTGIADRRQMSMESFRCVPMSRHSEIAQRAAESSE